MSKTRFAVSASTPFAAAPSTNRPRYASSASWLRLRLIARRSPSASPTVKPASAIATSSTWSWKTTTPNVDAQRLAQELVVDRPDVRRVLAQPLPRVDVRVHRLPLDRPGPHERDLDGEVVEVLRLRPQEALHLRAALDLERAHRVRALDLVEHLRVVEGDAREVDHLAARARDLLDAVLDRREHPEAEQVDLEEARVGARVLVPLAELAARHRRGLHRDELDERPRRDDHPARVLRDVARQARRSRRRARRTRASAGSRASARRRGAARPPPPPGVASQPSVSRASRSSSANGRPSALPTSRIAPRERYVAKLATSAACSRP